MEHEKLYSIGRITKLHGIKGAVILRGSGELSSLLKGQKVIFLEFDGYPVPFFPEETEFLSDDTAIVRFRDIGSPIKYEELPGREVFLSRLKTRRKKNLSIHDLIGYEFIDTRTGLAGKVTGAMDYELNPLLQVNSKNKEFLVPFTESIIRRIDHNQRLIEADLPEGLIDINENTKDE
ncbi:MAG: 16S rRNA processing protein RimM [Bacteroidales bacterium]|nr:16S rRNA processing protein RimM [Bacteroidales bacterium]